MVSGINDSDSQTVNGPALNGNAEKPKDTLATYPALSWKENVEISRLAPHGKISSSTAALIVFEESRSLPSTW